MLGEIPRAETGGAGRGYARTPNSRAKMRSGLVAVKGELGEAKVTANELLQAALRGCGPTRIVLGELRGAESVSFLRAIQHPPPRQLFHDPRQFPARRAIEQLSLMVMQTRHRPDPHRYPSPMPRA